MREIMLTALTQTKDETGVSYEKISARIERKTGVYISVSKLQRIFTGQQEPTVADYEMIAEAGLEMNLDKTYAKVGKQEVRDSEELEFMGAKALMEQFAIEKERIHTNYETRISTLVDQSDKRQQAFNDALIQIGDQYRKNANYLTDIIIDNEAYIRDLLAKTEHAQHIAKAAQTRAEKAESKIEKLDKKRFQVFWAMLAVVLLLIGIIIASMILNIPELGWGNL